jgi:hypothetical protein
MTWVALALLGGIVAVDATSVLQSMLSRPLVAALLTGLVLGRPEEALLLGLVLEAFALVILPIGAARYPEAGIGAVAASGGYLVAQTAEPVAGLLVAAVFGLGWERLAGGSVNLMRRGNEWLVRPVASAPRPADALERRHRLAIGIDFARGAVLASAGAWAAALLVTALAGYWALEPHAAIAALGVAILAMLGGSLALFGGWGERAVALSAGAAVGLFIVLAR